MNDKARTQEELEAETRARLDRAIKLSTLGKKEEVEKELALLKKSLVERVKSEKS